MHKGRQPFAQANMKKQCPASDFYGKTGRLGKRQRIGDDVFQGVGGDVFSPATGTVPRQLACHARASHARCLHSSAHFIPFPVAAQ